jgi:hypothetical protein
MIGAKQSTVRKTRRTLPDAERRLRASFPEVWAWYELLLTARSGGSAQHAADEAVDTRPRRLAR